MYTLIFMTQAQKDAKKLATCGLKDKALALLDMKRKSVAISARL